jgi:hypothetical protein
MFLQNSPNSSNWGSWTLFSKWREFWNPKIQIQESRPKKVNILLQRSAKASRSSKNAFFLINSPKSLGIRRIRLYLNQNPSILCQTFKRFRKIKPSNPQRSSKKTRAHLSNNLLILAGKVLKNLQSRSQKCINNSWKPWIPVKRNKINHRRSQGRSLNKKISMNW